MIQEWKNKGRSLLEIKVARFKRRLGNDRLTLRLCRLRDLGILRRLFTSRLFLEANGVAIRGFNTTFSVSVWAITTFQVIYLIEVEGREERRIVGFVGLYNIEIGRSLWLSLSIFSEDRRRGYGRQALGLILDYLQEARVGREMFAEVLRENISSLSFFKKLGFQVCGFHRDKLLLTNLFAVPTFKHLYDEHRGSRIPEAC
jgi:RimJ/RimL family protein N-acetyltransferase